MRNYRFFYPRYFILSFFIFLFYGIIKNHIITEGRTNLNKLTVENIKSIISLVKNDEYLSNLIDEIKKNSERRWILNPDTIIEQQITDCFIPYMTSFIDNEPHTFNQFIRMAYPETKVYNHSNESYSFIRFLENIEKLKKQYKGNHYIPPFVSYIIQSVIPNNKTNKGVHRNYNYKFFNACSFSLIMTNSDYLPYLNTNNFLFKEKCTNYFSFYAETNTYPLIDKIISQYYIDYYFSILLFSYTLQLIDQQTKTRPLAEYLKSENDYHCYLNYFIFLCCLLQNSSGMYAKYTLFDNFQRIFFDIKNNKRILLFKSSEDCFKQCAYELVLYNEIIYPYVKNLYFKEMDNFINNNISAPSPEDKFKNFSTIIEANINKTTFQKWQAVHIKYLNDLSYYLPEIEDTIFYDIFNKFYNYIPFYYNSKNLPLDLKPTLPDLLRDITMHVDFRIREIKVPHYINKLNF